jgi:hypothetical protein
VAFHKKCSIMNRSMLRLVLLRVAARLVIDWTTWAAIALAVVLAHSAVEHLDPAASLLQHYDNAFGAANIAYAVGAMQMVIAAALLWRRTRSGACAALAALALLALSTQILGGRAAEGVLPGLSVLGAAVAIAIGERRRAY